MGAKARRLAYWCAAFGAEEAGGRGVVLGGPGSAYEKEEGETWLAGEKVFSP